MESPSRRRFISLSNQKFIFGGRGHWDEKFFLLLLPLLSLFLLFFFFFFLFFYVLLVPFFFFPAIFLQAATIIVSNILTRASSALCEARHGLPGDSLKIV